MINTLLEHVPIKMEVQESEETNGIPVNSPQDDGVAKDDENIDETDEEFEEDGSEVEDDEEEEFLDEEEDEEESDIETDALEIEKEATMLISSDEEAELEAQRIRSPDIVITKKLRRDSNISSGSSTRSSQTSNYSSQPHITYEIVKQKDCTMDETNNKEKISPRLKYMRNKSLESYNKENNNKNTILLKQKTENKNLENNKSLENCKTKPEESNKRVDNHKTTEVNKNSENNRKKENLLKSPVNASDQKSRRGSSNSTCSVASTVASVSAKTESCGNIYVFNLEQKLIFNCEFCDLKYGDLDNFGLHLHEAHKLFNFDEDPEKENAPRNLGKSNRQSISAPKNSVNVKKEPLQYADVRAEPPVTLPPSALAEPLDSCGNVFMLNHRKLFLVCGYCECKYANLELFEKHLRQQHRIFEGCHNEVNVVPKVEVKEEVCVIPEGGNKPDIIPQAMVAIPSEIPLDITITPENEHETIAALEDVAVQEEEEEEAAKNDTVREETTLVEKPENSAVEEIATEKIAAAQEESMEHCVEVDNEQSCSAKPTEELSIVTGKEVSEASANTVVGENEKSENESKQQPAVLRKTRTKRQYSPDKQLESPSKRLKRNTRNNARIEQESPALNETDNQSGKSINTALVVEKENDTVVTIAKETHGDNKSTKSPQTLIDTTIEDEKQHKTSKSTKTKTHDDNKSTKSPQTLTDTTVEDEKQHKTAKSTRTKTHDNNKSTKSPQTITDKTSKSTQNIQPEKVTATLKSPTRDLSNTPELDQNTPFKETTARETTKGTDDEKTPVKLIQATETKKIIKPEKKTFVKSIKTRETRKTIDAEKAATETKKAIESADPEKSTSAKLADIREIKDPADSEKTTPLVLPESRETRKKKEPEKTAQTKLKESEKTAALKSPAMKESRKTRELVKTTSQKNSEMRETRTSTKRVAVENPSLEPVDPKKQSPLNTISNKKMNKYAIPAEAKPPEGEEKSETQNNKMKCSICFKQFTKQKSLIDHERTHQTGSNKMYECGVCGKDFLAKNERKSHMIARHSADTILECKLCYAAFTSKSGLECHNEKVHAAKLFKCDECFGTYRSESSLKTHIYKFHNASKKAAAKNKKNSAQKLKLSTTKEKDNSLSDEPMQEAVAQLGNNINVTKTADKSTDEIQSVVEEMPAGSSAVIFAIDDTNAKPMDITDAQLSVVDLESLTGSANANNSLHNYSGQTIFVADLGNQTDDHEVALELSSKNTGLKDLPIDKEDATKSLESAPTPFCNVDEDDDPTADPVIDIIEQLQNELAGTSSETTNNVVTYTINALPVTPETQKPAILDAQLEAVDKNEDVKPTFLKIVKYFVCDICSKTYYKHSRLIEHKRLHTGEKPFGCDECGKQFRVRNRLNEHKQRHSKIKKFQCEICQLPLCTRQEYNVHMRHHANDRRHRCSVCPKAFVRSSDLKIHERIHTGEKPYVCDVCHKCFRANQNLSVHKKSHMGDVSKTFKCEYCEKKFMRKIDRKVHMRTHTGEKPYKCEICQRGYSSRVNVRAHVDRDHIKGNQEEKKKPGPKPRSLREKLERQKKLIEELQNQLLQRIKTDEKVILSDDDVEGEHILPDSPIKVSSPTTTPIATTKDDPVQSAYKLLNKLKASSCTTSSTTTSKSLRVIPSPPPLEQPPSSPLTGNAKKDSTTTLLPLTITRKLEQASPATSASASTSCVTTPSPPLASTTATASTSCVTTPSPPPPSTPAAAKATATKVVSQKTSLGIQQVSVTVSMQVENVTANSNTVEKENSQILTTTPPAGATSVKKERKITSYFTVLDQKSKG